VALNGAGDKGEMTEGRGWSQASFLDSELLSGCDRDFPRCGQPQKLQAKTFVNFTERFSLPSSTVALTSATVSINSSTLNSYAGNSSVFMSSFSSSIILLNNKQERDSIRFSFIIAAGREISC